MKLDSYDLDKYLGATAVFGDGTLKIISSISFREGYKNFPFIIKFKGDDFTFSYTQDGRFGAKNKTRDIISIRMGSKEVSGKIDSRVENVININFGKN